MYLVIDTAFVPTVECIVSTRDEAAIFVEKERRRYHNNFNEFFRWSEELEIYQRRCLPFKKYLTIIEEELIKNEFIKEYGEKRAPLVQQLFIVEVSDYHIINYFSRTI